MGVERFRKQVTTIRSDVAREQVEQFHDHRNPKHEILNKSEIRISNVKNIGHSTSWIF